MPRHSIPLDHHPEWLEFFRLAEGLLPGAKIEMTSRWPGPRGKRELIGFRSWIAAERKRRKAEVVTAMLVDSRIPNEAMESADPLQGITTSLWQSGDYWVMELGRESWHTVRYTEPGGEAKVLWKQDMGPVGGVLPPNPECEYEPTSIQGGQHD